jgi:hypothetical protein
MIEYDGKEYQVKKIVLGEIKTTYLGNFFTRADPFRIDGLETISRKGNTLYVETIEDRIPYWTGFYHGYMV